MDDEKSLKEVLSEHRLWVESEGKRGHRLNLSKQCLAGADFSDTDLSKADLQRANLTDSNMREADFRGANLNVARLEGTKFSWRSLVNAGLTLSDDGRIR